MLANYLTIAIRNLTKNKVYSFINIMGLGFGLACVFLIINFVQNELAYDRHHQHADDIYRVIWSTDNPQTRTPHPMAQAMVADFAEVQSAVTLSPLWGVGLTRETFSFRNIEKDIRYDESNVIAVDTTFFDVFTVPLIHGNPKTALKNTGGILISASMARKYFGDENPMGKQLAVNSENYLIEVVGVFEDFPPTSHFKADFLVSYLREKALEDPESNYFTWFDFGHYNYIRLKPGADATALESRMMEWIRKYIEVSDEEFKAAIDKNFGFRLQPLTDIHLHSHVRWELEPNGYIEYIYIMSAAALLILVIGCINFINLTTAQSTERLREIGVRKSLGATRTQLTLQFTGESVLVSIAAAVVAGALIELGAPWITVISGKPVTPDYAFFFLILGGLGLLTGVIAGIFPSFYLANLQPGRILKGGSISGQHRGMKSFFTVFQFFASMVLLSASLIIYQQLGFIQNQDLGFQQDEVLVIPIKNRSAINPRLNELRNELMKVPGVSSVSAASNIPGKSFNQNGVFSSQNPTLRVSTSESLVDYDFFNVMGISLAAGRTFSRENPADRDAFLINETLASNIFGGDAVGKEMTWDHDSGPIKGTVIGVVRDFHFQSLHNSVDPLLFRLSSSFNYAVLKVGTQNFSEAIHGIEAAWRVMDPEFAFEYSFLRNDLQQQYVEEQNMAGVLTAFTVIAVAIACIGLLGIAALTFRQKTKEVSVRKVLGATRTNLMLMLIGDFSKMILIAVALAVPLVWYLMSQWLQNFILRIEINPLLFVSTGLLLLLFSWATLGYLTWKVSNVNPADTLKSE